MQTSGGCVNKLTPIDTIQKIISRALTFLGNATVVSYTSIIGFPRLTTLAFPIFVNQMLTVASKNVEAI